MKRFLFFLFIISILAGNTVESQADSKVIKKETFTYSIKGNDTLRLDKYTVPDISTPKACIIFVFGGGFSGGSKDSKNNVNYLENLARMGYVSVGIDYRLGMKNVKMQEGENPMELVSKLENSIAMAVEDLYDATSFVYKKANEWNINRNLIIANGSSAGAVTVLQAEYLICTNSELTRKLPENFNYAGIISFAGAIAKSTDNFELKRKPAPIQFFHGDADSNVPFDKLEIGNIGLYGSLSFSEELKKMKSPYYFYQVNNAAHEIAETPMKHNLNEISVFIQRMVINKSPLMIHTESDEIGKPELKKDFTIIDFIQSNY